MAGKNIGSRCFALSSLLWSILVVHFVVGLMICRDGMRALAASVGGEDMNLADCHILDSSSPSSQFIQCSAFAFFMLSA